MNGLDSKQIVEARNKGSRMWDAVGWNYIIENTRRSFGLSHEEAWNTPFVHNMYLMNIKNMVG